MLLSAGHDFLQSSKYMQSTIKHSCTRIRSSFTQPDLEEKEHCTKGVAIQGIVLCHIG